MTIPLASSSSEVDLIAVDPKSAERLWLAALPFISRSYQRSDLQVPADLLASIIWKKRVLWLLVETGGAQEEIIGAGITSTHEIAGGAKMCKIEHFAAKGGSISRWLDLRSKIERYAREEGCDRVLFDARLGWQKYLTDYEPVAVVLEKRL